jgi:hypothetical protein
MAPRPASAITAGGPPRLSPSGDLFYLMPPASPPRTGPSWTARRGFGVMPRHGATEAAHMGALPENCLGGLLWRRLRGPSFVAQATTD